MKNKRDELAEEMYSEDQAVLANQFKIGWDMCENEYNGMASIDGGRIVALMDENKKLQNELKVQEGIFQMFQKGLVKDTERLHKLQADHDKFGVALEYLQFECRQACHYDLLKIIDEALAEKALGPAS